MCYADDVFNISRSIQRIEENFQIMQNGCDHLGLKFNSAKSNVVLFNWKAEGPLPTIVLGDSCLRTVESVVYLGLPIGSSLKHPQARF